MGIFSRIKSIVRANVNDKKNNKNKSVDELLYELRVQLAKIKTDANEIISIEKRAKAELDKIKFDLERFTLLKLKAVQAGNISDAEVFQKRIVKLENQMLAKQENYRNIQEKAVKIRDLHDRLVNSIKDIENRYKTANATMSVAEAQEILNKFNQPYGEVDKLNSIIDQLDATAEVRLQNAEDIDIFDKEN